MLGDEAEVKRILFGGIVPMNYYMFESVYHKLKDDARIQVYFTGMYLGKDDPFTLYEPFGIPKKAIIKEKRLKWKSFDMYITPTYHLVKGRQKVKVQTFHSTSFRNVSISKEALSYDKLFMTGNYMKQEFVKRGILEADDPRIEIIGMPQIDCLVDGSIDAEALRTELKLDKGLPTVMFTPTWAEPESHHKMIKGVIEAACEMDVNFLLKLHDHHYFPYDNPFDWKKLVDEYQQRFKNLRVIRGYNSSPYLVISDCLISDASAVAWQFAVLDRPVIYMDVDMEAFKKQWSNTDLQPWGRKAGVVVKDASMLKETIEQELKEPGRLSEIRRRMAEDAFYKPGTAAERTKEKICELIGL